MESLKGITQFNTGSMIANGMKLSESAVNSYRASIDGLTLSQAQVALSSTALNNIQKEQILTSAGLLKSTEAVTLEEIKQMAASASLSAQKKEEILTTLQGAYSENQWNIEKLEAIVASGGEAGAIAQSILAKKAENAENIKNIAGSKALTASLWGQLKARLALMATNPAVWIAGIVGAGLGLIALENKFSKSLDECTEELDKLNSEFEQSQSEAESLESEWENCKTRLDELQKLADNGTISIIEQEEYERLQKTNDELERSLRIEKEKSQLSAIKGATTADETLTKRVQSQYIRGSVESYEGVVLEDQILSVFPEEELDAAIEEYQRIQVEIDKLNKSYDNGEISTSDYEKQLGSLTEQQTKARTRASEMSDILSDCKQAYDNLNNTGGSFTTTQKNNYNAVTEANKRYNDFLGTINDVNETFENLDTTEKARTLKDRYAKKTLSLPNGQGTYTVDDKEISDWIDTLSDEDLKILGTINFSGEQTKDSMQEALDYAKIHTNANPDEITVPKLSIPETIDKLNTELKPSFDALGEAYQEIFTLDDNNKEVFSLENVDLSMLDSVKSAIDEINENEELGIHIDYTDFENFTRVLTDTSSTSDQVKTAFNDFATSMFNAVDATEGMSESTAQLMESMLESMGVTNANEVVMHELALRKEEAELASMNLAKATYWTIQGLFDEANMANVTREEIYKLAVQEIAFGENDLNISKKVEKLGVLAKAYGDATTEAIALEAADRVANEHGDYETIFNDMIASANRLKSENAIEIDFGKVDAPKSKSKSGSKADKHLEEYKSKLSMLEDQLDQQLITEREFFDQSEALLNQYLKDTPAHIEKYAEEISNAEKALHDNWIEAYEAEAEELGRFRDKNLIDMAEYYQSMMSLQDEYYNSEALKLTQLADKMEAEYGRMNSINLTRPTVTATDMQTAGYTTPTVEKSATHAMTFGNEETQVVVTPILPNGEILSPEELTDYANKLLKGEKIDANIELAMFNGKDADKQATEYIKGLETVQGEYAKLKEAFAENPYGDFTDEQLEAIEKLTEELDNVMSELSGELGDIKSAYDELIEIRDTYNEYGKISVDQYQNLCDMGFQYLALLSNESGALALDEAAFQRLTDAKVQEMQVTLALQAADLINNIYTEADAIQYLASSYSNLAAQAINAAEAMLYAAQANAAKTYGANSMQAQAANVIVKGYENTKLLAGATGAVDIKMQSGGGYPEPKEEKKKKEEKEKEPSIRDWAEKFLDNIGKALDKTAEIVEKISDKTSRLIDSVDKFVSWQKKNLMITRAVKSTDKEIKANQKHITAITDSIKKVQKVANFYKKQLDAVGLSQDYQNKIKNGKLEIESIADEGLQESIEKYEELYEKIEDCNDKMDDYKESIQECEDAVADLFDQQRDLIRQKLDNVIDYYSDMDSYLSSITSKIESLISLNDAMGKRSSLTELLNQFSDLSAQLSSTSQTEVKTSVTEIDFGESDKVKEAIKRDTQAQIDAIQAEIDNLDVDQSGTYTKLLQNIAKTEAQIDKYIDKGWDVTKEKQFDKLIAKLDDYYDLQAELDAYATSNTIANYSKVYTAFQKLQNKLDNGGTLSKSQQKKYDSYLEQLEQMRNDKDDILTELETKLGIAQGTIKDSTAEQKARQAIADVQEKLEDTATYQNILNSIEQTEEKIAKLDEKGYDNLTKAQKKTYDKLVQTLEDYYEKKDAFDENATASTIAQYDKVYTAWKKLQDKLDAGQNLNDAQWKSYNEYTKQLAEFEKSKDRIMSDLETELDNIINPKDKISAIDAGYEEAAEGIYESYQDQIDNIKSAITETEQYKNLLAKAQKLEQKKDTKGLSKTEQANLDKYNAKLKALREGATTSNIAEYMATWEKWYTLQQKLNKNGKLSASDAKNYDTYTAQLEEWNKEKQSQIDDLMLLMEQELEALQKTYVENVSEAESEASDYYANLYSLAKQIAEYNLTTLQSQLSFLEAYISYYQQLVTLYDQFSSDKLTKLLSDLDIGLAESQESLYAQYLDKLNQKYDATLSKINEYNELIEAIDTNDFEGSMQLFQDAIAEYKTSGQTAMANKLQSVLDLLNERAVDQDNWGEYADQWLVEWEEALAGAKNELISIAGSIQEVNDALREIKFSNITGAIQELSNAQDMLASITGLINDDWLYDENDNLTQHGLTKVGLLVEQMNSAKLEANRYAELIQSIQDMQSTYSSDEAYQTALQEAKMNYLTSLSDLQSYQDSIVSILVKADEAVINSLTDVINKRKEALQKKKELYDYGKTIDKSQKEVDSIKAQIDALESLSGAMDTATKAKLAQLKADLAEKEEALQDTKDEHTYNLQIDALDEFLATLSDTMSSTTESVNKSFETYISAINSALELYNQNKDYLNDWSNSIIETVSGLGDSLGSTVELDTNVSDLSDVVNATDISLPSSSMISVETQNAIKECQDILKNGVLIKVDNPLQVGDTQLFNLMNSYMPQMALGVNNTIPNLIKGMNNQTVVNVHYDSLLNVQGNVDSTVVKSIPNLLEQSYRYTAQRLMTELNRLR